MIGIRTLCWRQEAGVGDTRCHTIVGTELSPRLTAAWVNTGRQPSFGVSVSGTMYASVEGRLPSGVTERS
jgi:hypothetical protein